MKETVVGMKRQTKEWEKKIQNTNLIKILYLEYIKNSKLNIQQKI